MAAMFHSTQRKPNYPDTSVAVWFWWHHSDPKCWSEGGAVVPSHSHTHIHSISNEQEASRSVGLRFSHVQHRFDTWWIRIIKSGSHHFDYMYQRVIDYMKVRICRWEPSRRQTLKWRQFKVESSHATQKQQLRDNRDSFYTTHPDVSIGPRLIDRVQIDR